MTNLFTFGADPNAVYLIRWKLDSLITIVSGKQLEALIHSNKKWYGYDKPQFDILRKATESDLVTFPAESPREQAACRELMNKS